VNGLFLRERTKTSRNVTISFSQSPERATATRGRVQLVSYKMLLNSGMACVARPYFTKIIVVVFYSHFYFEEREYGFRIFSTN
jgi:hypothetical protein